MILHIHKFRRVGRHCRVQPFTRSFSDNTKFKHESYETAESEEKQKGALTATKVGAAANLFLTASKGLAGYAVGSTALIADCFNSLGDLFSDAVVYYTVTQARQIATPERPWGQGKIEPIGDSDMPVLPFEIISHYSLTGALLVSGLLGMTGAGKFSLFRIHLLLSTCQGLDTADSQRLLSYSK